MTPYFSFHLKTHMLTKDMLTKDMLFFYKKEITRLEFDNAIKEIKEKELKDRIKELEEIFHNALNDKRFKIKVAVLSISIKLIFGLAGLYIAVYRNDVITHALVHAFQHYCM